MRKVFILIIFLLLTLTLRAADRDLTLAREMLEDTIIRDDAAGIRMARERATNLAAEAEDPATLRDANYLAALAAVFESFTGFIDPATSARAVATGIHHIDRAMEIDPQFADAWMISSSLRRSARRPPPPNSPNHFLHALELDAKSPAVAFFNGIVKSINPNGPANPEGIRIFDELADRLDADRAATGRRFALWDAEAYAWRIIVRMASDEPRAEILRPMAARLIALRPDFAQGQQLVEAVAERTFVSEPAVTWQPMLTDAAGDGKNAQLPDVVAADRAENGDRVWYRVTFRDPLPRSFGVNVVVNRSGDPAAGMKWWGKDSAARFDRLVTAWISRDGDHYFGRVGVTDDDGARGTKLGKITTDVQIAMGAGGKSVMLGVPRDALGLTPASTIVVAGGSHLVWNDDAASAANSR